MKIPEHLHELVDQLGQALVQALVVDPATRALAREIQGEGFEVTLLLEATVALRKREAAEGAEPTEDLVNPNPILEILPEAPLVAEPERPASPWSKEDRDFLRTFKISLD